MELSEVLGILLATGILAGTVAWGVVRTKRERERVAARNAALRAHAAHREWDFTEREDRLLGKYDGAPFGRGRARKVVNVLSGRHDGRPFTAFDYEYVTTSGSGKGRKTHQHRYSVVALELGLHTPGLEVSPQDFLARIVDAVTGRDLEIGHPVFDRTFSVTSPSPDFARDLLCPAVVEVALHHPQLAWRFQGDAMLVIREGEHSPHEVEGKLHFMDAVLDRVPPHVRDRLLG